MGLDITACRQATRTGDYFDDYRASEHVVAVSPGPLDWSNKEFGRATDLSAGIYSAAERFDFRAGSYSGYGSYRDDLARLVGHASARSAWRVSTEGPFLEQINFADNEGYIGPAVAKKLAADYAAHQAQADAIGGWFAEVYGKWRQAFDMAADGGFVAFH